jgi:ATP-dependent DNA ligase
MLCERLTDPRRLADRRYIAEPKLDGQRAQLHVQHGEAVACFSRHGLDLLRHPGMAWLRSIAWPFESAIFDGEACAGDGHEGIQAVFTERSRIGGDMSLVLFDVLHVQGRNVMGEPRRDRRKRLEDLFDGRRIPRMGVVPVTVARHEPFELKAGKRASLVCWGVMPSGLLRHPLFLGWS